MRWFLLVSFLFCFSSVAEVVCRAPGGGDDASEAGSTTSACNPSATETSREENPEETRKKAEYLADQRGANNTGTSGDSEHTQ